MNIKTRITLIVVLSLTCFITIKNLYAQVHVDSTRYDLMLSTLLSHSVDEISVDDAYADSSAIFIDAREYNEFNISHIRNAIWVGFDKFDSTKLAEIDKNKKIIVYCSVGYRSEKITEKLMEMGFADTWNLYGGIFEWVNNNYPVVDSEGRVTNKIHAYSPAWGVWLYKGEKVY